MTRGVGAGRARPRSAWHSSRWFRWAAPARSAALKPQALTLLRPGALGFPPHSAAAAAWAEDLAQARCLLLGGDGDFLATPSTRE